MNDPMSASERAVWDALHLYTNEHGREELETFLATILLATSEVMGRGYAIVSAGHGKVVSTLDPNQQADEPFGDGWTVGP